MRVKYYYVHCFVALQTEMLGSMTDSSVAGPAVIKFNVQYTLTYRFASHHSFVKIAHQWPYYLPCHIDEFREIFLEQNLNSICVSELWLISKLALSEVFFYGYTLFRNGVNKNDGRVAIYIKSTNMVTLVCSSDQQNFGTPE